MVYRWSAWRYLGSMIAIGLVGSTIGWLVAFLLWSALVRRLGSSELIGGIAYVVLYTLFFATFSLLLTWRRPPGLTFDDTAVELAAGRRDALVIPYPAVASTRIRWFWPIAVLDVFVNAADEPQVTHRDRDGRRPLRKRRGDQVRFSMPVLGLTATTADIRSQLHTQALSG